MAGTWVRRLTALTTLAAGVWLVLAPGSAPLGVLVALLLAFGPVWRGWVAARGTALRAALGWAGVAVGLGVVAQAFALTEPLASGRPWAGHWTYLAALAALAALISVLNARTPGGGAWAILMALLVLVFLIPWLEGAGLGRAGGGLGRLRLDTPWTLFYGLLVVAGVTNYLPTRYGPAAVALAAGFALEYGGLTGWAGSASARGVVWSAVPWTFALAAVLAEWRSGAVPASSAPVEAVWFWFRDHWGVVWALRVMERWNRTAEAQGWGFRLGWHGLVPAAGGAGPTAGDEAAALATLRTLLRRFAGAERLARAEAGVGRGAPCQGPCVAG